MLFAKSLGYIAVFMLGAGLMELWHGRPLETLLLFLVGFVFVYLEAYFTGFFTKPKL